MTWRYYVAGILMTLGFAFTVMPFLCLFYVVGWIWCCAVDGFRLARTTYELYRDAVGKL